MMFSRTSNLYLVLGWLADDAIRNSMMMDKGDAAREHGITLTVSDDGKKSFVGKYLGMIEIRDGQTFVAVDVPTPAEEKAIEDAAREIGLGATGRPQLFVVAG